MDVWDTIAEEEGAGQPLPRRRRRCSEPALTLRLGPFAIPLVPAAEAPAPAQPKANDGAPADAASRRQPCTAVARLRAELAQRDPRLGERLAACGEPLDDACLARWLAARGGSAAAASAGIAAHAAWREGFVGAGSGGRIQEGSMAEELAARKVFLQGPDAAGCPVVVVQAARHDMGRRDLRQTKRLIAYTLDSASATADPARNPWGRICCLFDLAGLRPRNLDVKALLAIFELLQQHYPERLDSLFFLNAPWLFWGVWRVVSPFVHTATRRKIHFIGGDEGRRQLLQRIPAAVLPARYGGASELVPIDGAMTAWRRRQAAEAAGAASTAEASSSGGSSRSASATLRRRAGGAAHAARRFVHGKLVRPVGGAAAGAARALHRHQQALLRRHGGSHAASLSEQQQRSLLASVVLTHVLLVSLLLRMLGRVLLRRRPAPAIPAPKALEGALQQHQQREEGGEQPPAEAAAPAGPAKA